MTFLCLNWPSGYRISAATMPCLVEFFSGSEMPFKFMSVEMGEHFAVLKERDGFSTLIADITKLNWIVTWKICSVFSAIKTAYDLRKKY